MNPSSYRVNARAVVQRRGAPPTEPPTDYSLALLLRAPAPEAGPVDEIEAPEYVRQPLRWVSATEGAIAGPTLRNANQVSFGPALAWPQASHAAVLDQSGEVVAYGRLETAPGHAGADEVAFSPTSIQLRFN